MSKILVAFNDYLYNEDRKRLNQWGGIGYYRQIKPASCIKDHEVTVVGSELINYGDDLESQWDNIFKKFDVFWTSYFANPQAGAACIYHAQKHGKKVIIDIDDNYLDVPKSNNVYDKFKPGSKDRAFLSTILSFADALTVSTEPLKQRLFEHIKDVHGIEKPIFVIPNMSDATDWDVPIAEKSKDKFIIGYSGGNSHFDDVRMVLPALAKIMKKYKHVHLEFIGTFANTEVPKYFKGCGFTDETLNRISLKPSTATFKEYPGYLASQDWNLGICPLVDTAFTRSKSHIKFLEYAMCKIPTIASKVYPYHVDLCGREVITDGETGFLCNPNDWEKTIEKLINNENLRNEIAENAYNHVIKNWQYKDGPINETVNKMLS